MTMPDDNPYVASETSIQTNASDIKGTKLAGFFIGWAIMIVSGIIARLLFSVVIAYTNHYEGLIFVGISVALMPFISLIIGIIWFVTKKQPNMAKGAALSLLSFIVILILLAAACFGMMASY